MVTVVVDGQDKTHQVSDWKIWSSGRDLLLTCYFPSGKTYTRPLEVCRIEPFQVLEDQLLKKAGQYTYDHIDKAEIYGNKYAIIRYLNNDKPYVMSSDGIEIVNAADTKDSDIFQYFEAVAKNRLDLAASKDAGDIHANIIRQMEALSTASCTALNAYCSRSSVSRENNNGLIFPFRMSASQLKAVSNVFSSQVSVIEGPPGTGKTQTILNIIANIVLRGETVAILSNNNTAVQNVYEKLDKAGLGYLVAKLGSAENRSHFFSNLPQLPTWRVEEALTIQEINNNVDHLLRFLEARNDEARLVAELDELGVERERLMRWRQQYKDRVPVYFSEDSIGRYGLSSERTTQLMAYLRNLGDGAISLKNRIEMWFRFRIFRTAHINTPDKREAMIGAFQVYYYDIAIKEKQKLLQECRLLLKSGGYEQLLDDVNRSSMSYLKYHLRKRTWPKDGFDAQNYRQKIDVFLSRYPIVGSSSHSIINSLKPGTVLDYAIIDEASQQDIIPGILALGCAKNVVIVGDKKQLSPIFTKTGVKAPDARYDCERQSLLDSFTKVFDEAIPTTLLREHYRCHPRIIQFCNQQFYDGQLVPMTSDNGEEALQLIVTSKGNHTRGNKNQREVDSVLHVLEMEHASDWDEAEKRGFIAPYNQQVALSRRHLPDSFVSDTTHKFQGRECEEIVFSTVLDKKGNNQRQLSFVDDDQLINVAVSRAINRFTLVTGDGVFEQSKGPIAALIRHIEYYAGEMFIHRSPVISAFDLLYREYDDSLMKLKSGLRASDSVFMSERIVAHILREVLTDSAYQALTFHMQVKLNQLVSLENEIFTYDEQNFILGRSRCDFVLYYKVGKKPLAVIEVDGSAHEHSQQREWDSLKDSILEKSGVLLLRLRTVESDIENKIRQFINVQSVS